MKAEGEADTRLAPVVVVIDIQLLSGRLHVCISVSQTLTSPILHPWFPPLRLLRPLLESWYLS